MAHSTPPDIKTWRPILLALANNLLIALAYVGLTLPVSPPFGLVAPGMPAPAWPPASLGALAILLGGARWMPGIFTGSYLANVYFMSAPPSVALLESIGNAAGPLLALAALKLLRIDRKHIFDTVGGAMAFALLPGTLNPAITAAIGSLALWWGNSLAGPMPGQMALVWGVTDACAVLILTPALHAWAHPREPSPVRSLTEEGGTVILTLLMSLLIFWAPDTGSALQHGAVALILLPTIWSALRFSRRYAASLLVTVFLLAIGGTLQGRGSLAMMPLIDPLAGVQLMGFALGVTVLIAAALNREREHYAGQLTRLNVSLEGKIRQRTRDLEKSRAELRHQLAFQQAFLDSLPNPVFYTDLDGAYVLCGQAFQNLAGRSQTSLQGRNARDLFGAEAGDLHESQLLRLQESGGPLSFTMRLPQEGRAHDYIVSLAPVASWQGEVQGVAGMMQDVTDMKRLELALKENEARFRLMVETLPSPMLLARRRDGALLFANDAAVLSLGLDQGALAEYRAAEFWQDPAQYGELLAELDRAGLVRGRELRLQRANGEPLWLLASVALTELSGEAALILAFEDITRTKEREAELYNQATTDALTGVTNRRHFLALTQGEMQRAARNKQPWALLMVDLDHFKQVNDSFGHLCGDRVLKEVAAMLQRHLRSIDLLGRLGGEEFAIFLPNTDAAAAQEVAERVRQAVQEGNVSAECAMGLVITISVGLFLHECSDTLPDLSACLARADAALYAAKAAGRNRVALAPAALH